MRRRHCLPDRCVCMAQSRTVFGSLLKCPLLRTCPLKEPLSAPARTHCPLSLLYHTYHRQRANQTFEENTLQAEDSKASKQEKTAETWRMRAGMPKNTIQEDAEDHEAGPGKNLGSCIHQQLRYGSC